jgi:hypothetical protein
MFSIESGRVNFIKEMFYDSEIQVNQTQKKETAAI